MQERHHKQELSLTSNTIQTYYVMETKSQEKKRQISSSAYPEVAYCKKQILTPIK